MLLRKQAGGGGGVRKKLRKLPNPCLARDPDPVTARTSETTHVPVLQFWRLGVPREGPAGSVSGESPLPTLRTESAPRGGEKGRVLCLVL